MPEVNPKSSSLERRRLQTILHKLESLLNDSAEIKGSINIQIGPAWISLGEGNHLERHEKLHVEGILKMINPWTKSEELSGFSLYFEDDPDGPYARINIHKMDISILLDMDRNILPQD
jgi:restriction endonuclease S subunit